jgi:hypothetical protein
LFVIATAAPARAADCYRVEAGAKLYEDVMADTEVGAVTADVIGRRYGWDYSEEPTIEVHLDEVDGDVVRESIVVRVLRANLTAVACPTTSLRDGHATEELTWPDAGWAGSAPADRIAARQKRARSTGGRACFASSVTGVRATVCTSVAPAKETCVAIAAGKPLYARATTAAKVGVTTLQVIGTQLARLDNLLAVRVEDDELARHDVYVRRKDTRAARCPRRAAANVGVLGSIPPVEALLPDGSDARFRVFGPSWGSEEPITARGMSLRCFDHEPVTGLQLRVCTADPRK